MKNMLVILKVLVFLQLVFIITAKSQTETCNFYKDKGYSCVLADNCKTSKCLPYEVGNTKIGNADIRSGIPEGGDTKDCNDKEQSDILLSECPDIRTTIEEEYLVCCHRDQITDVNIIEPPKDYKCGHQNGKLDPRNLIRPSSGENEWPHVCAIIENSRGTFLGGGSLISPGIVLTAAHLVFDIKDQRNLIVRCSIHNISLANDDYEEAKVDSISIHPRFEASSLQYNFALLHLSEDFDISSNLNPICLPELQENNEELDETKCVAAGWGKDSKGGQSKLSETLREVKIPIVNNEKCQKAIKAVKGDNFIVHPSFICAGGEKNVDTCEGDGGSPLFCQRKSSKVGKDTDAYVHIGIVSWGVGCGARDIPGIYASTRYGLCFIDWATKCIHGRKYTKFFDYPDCDDWAIDEEDAIENQIRRFKIASSVQKSQPQLEINRREIKKLENELKNLKKFARSCKGGSDNEEDDLEVGSSDLDATEERSILSGRPE